MRLAAAGLGVILAATAAGCTTTPTRVATRITEVPRADLEVEGNRGYLLGSAPQSGERKTTRQIIQVDVELPTYYKPKKKDGSVAMPMPPSSEGAIRVSAADSPSVESGPMDTYIVQKGDSLSSIAAQPEIYGKATAWKRIFDANRELLKGNPDRVRAGMSLKIPRGKSQTISSGDDGGTTFRK